MKRLTPDERRKLVDAAMGRRRFDLLMKNVKLVNVFSGEIYPAEIGLSNGYIAHVEKIQKGNSLEAGAVFGKEEIERIISMERILGVAEVMDYYGVINNSKRMREILDLALERDCFVQGHFFSHSDRELSAYLCAGPNTNHEFITGRDARRAIRAGMVVDARESSFAKNVKSMLFTRI
jgi:adenine deaminase